MAEVTLVSSFDGPPDAPVLILGNPIGTNRDVWARQLPVLSRHFRVLRYEARGHGRPGEQSPAPPGPYTIADLGGDVLALADAHGIERFGYAGVSLGGMTGIWLAATAPERITSLAVCCAALVRAEGMAPLAGQVVPRWFTPAFMAREPAAVRTVTDMLTATTPEGYAGCGEAIAALDLRPLLPSVQAPTLVLSGAEDVAAPPSVGAATAEAIPGARLTVIEDASHFAHYERPGPVTDALLAHFTSVPPYAGGPGSRTNKY